MRKIFWVGTRQSDIEHLSDVFCGSITIFGDNRNGNIAYCSGNNRINHNIDNEECDLFFISTLTNLCLEDDSIRFLFYNPILAHKYGGIIKEHTLCLNPLPILDMFSNKMRSRLALRNIAETIPFVVLRGTECSYENICSFFVECDEFIIQSAVSSGGEGTIHIDSTSNCTSISPDDEYLVSPYINNAVPLNTHIIISNNDIMVFPSSVQIVSEISRKLLYCGGDYICYRGLPEKVQSKVVQEANKLGEFAQKKGYRGILGIDFLLKEDHLYFVEFNARFQASSQLINEELKNTYKTSLQEINLQAFNGEPFPKLESMQIDYSNFVYTTNNVTYDRINRIIRSDEVYKVQLDGYNTDTTYPCGEDIYLARCVFNQNICSFSNSKLTLHPNIYVENIKPFLVKGNPLFKENVKFALLNHGVILTPAAVQLAKRFGQIQKAVFDAIDTIIFSNVYVNIPCTCKFNSISPFSIDRSGDEFILLFDGVKITKVQIFFVPEVLLGKKTKSGVPFDSIINLATDRIRINPAPVCYYKQQGIACKFCNLPDYNNQYDLEDIIEAIDYCLDNVNFRHFLIGGGTYSLDNSAWNIIIQIANHIRARCDKDIYLMTIPPENGEIEHKLKNAGITEVAFNLEVFDRKLAVTYMPGKGHFCYEQYITALKYAVALWGSSGKVRSLLIYGFDTDEVFLSGIKELCRLGVEPIISIFRPLKHTELEHLNPPSTLDVFSIYEKCLKITSQFSLVLGPDCPMCQNNTLSFSE